MKRKNYIGLKAWNMGFDAHLTLIYTGNVNPDMERHIQEVIYTKGRGITDMAARIRIAMYGRLKDIPAVEIEISDRLWRLRTELLKAGVPDRSGYPFTPHVTLKFEEHHEVRIPELIMLNDLGFY